MMIQQVSCAQNLFSKHQTYSLIVPLNSTNCDIFVTLHFPPTLSLQETYTLESERNLVARHYEHTYDQVNHQIDSARQLVEIRKQTQDPPDRPYPRRPKNRVNYINVL